MSAADDDWGEERANYRQIIATQQNRIERMVVALTDTGLDDISLRVALAVEDQFAQNHPGGRIQRLAKIQVIIRSAVQRATQGDAAWNAWSPDSCGLAPDKPRGEGWKP